VSLIAGVDGCRGGWLAVLLDTTGNGPPRLVLCASFAEVAVLPEAPAVIAVDMPIGLPERSQRGGRACEAAVRARLGPRQSSVFSTPSRAAVMETDYRQACATALATSDPPRKVARQAFNLFGRIREIDALLRGQPELRERVFEAHPEASFCAMNGGTPAALPKKIGSRPNPPGLAERRDLLLASDIPPALLDWSALPDGAGGDDLLDACACLWTAARILARTAECHPPDPPRDALGLEMPIRA
jgi:predicted RNase H-like nuclease